MIVVRVGFLSSRKLTVLGLRESSHPGTAIRFASTGGSLSTSDPDHFDRQHSIVEMKSLATEIGHLFDTEHSRETRDKKHSRVVPDVHVSESTLISSKAKKASDE